MSQIEVIEEALIQAAYFQIAVEKSLTVQSVDWGSGRALVPLHWRAEATERAKPYIRAVTHALFGDGGPVEGSELAPAECGEVFYGVLLGPAHMDFSVPHRCNLPEGHPGEHA